MDPLTWMLYGLGSLAAGITVVSLATVLANIAWKALCKLTKRVYKKAKKLVKRTRDIATMVVRVTAKRVATNFIFDFFFGPSFHYVRGALALNGASQIIEGAQEVFKNINEIKDDAIKSSVQNYDDYVKVYSMK